MLVQNPRGCLAQMIDAARRPGDANANIVAVEEVPMERIHMYGVVGVGKSKGNAGITQMVEEAASARTRRPISRSPDAISCSRKSSISSASRPSAQVAKISSPTPCWRSRETQPFYGLKFEGRSYDCGSKIGFLAANVAYATRLR